MGILPSVWQTALTIRQWALYYHGMEGLDGSAYVFHAKGLEDVRQYSLQGVRKGRMLALSATIFVDEGLAFFSSFLGGMLRGGKRQRGDVNVSRSRK